MISFTINVKNEIASFNGVKDENIAMLSAIIRYSGKIDNSIVIQRKKKSITIFLLSANLILKNIKKNNKKIFKKITTRNPSRKSLTMVY